MSPSRALAAATAVALLTAWLATGTTRSGWTVSTLANDADTARTGSVGMSVGYQPTTCSAGPRVATQSCPGTLTPATSPPATRAVTIQNLGDLTSWDSPTQTIAGASCGPAKLDDSKASADPMLPRYATSFLQTDKWGTSSSAAFASGAYAADVVTTNVSAALGGNLSIGVWFKVANGYTGGGGLISLAASPAASPSTGSSPALWLDSSGKVRFAVASTTGAMTGASSATYNDGNWHLAVLAVSSAVVSAATLYVDKAAGVSSVGVSLLATSSGMWHAGWADFSGISGAPGSAFLAGALGGGFVAASAVSPGTPGALYDSSSANSYSTQVLALSGIQHLWMFSDDGIATFGGTLPTNMASACTKVKVAFDFSGPSGTIASQSLASFVDSGGVSVPAPGSGVTQQLTVSTSQGSGYNSDLAGLRLVVPLSVTHNPLPNGKWPLSLTWPSASAVFLG